MQKYLDIFVKKLYKKISNDNEVAELMFLRPFCFKYLCSAVMGGTNNTK